MRKSTVIVQDPDICTAPPVTSDRRLSTRGLPGCLREAHGGGHESTLPCQGRNFILGPETLFHALSGRRSFPPYKYPRLSRFLLAALSQRLSAPIMNLVFFTFLLAFIVTAFPVPSS